MLRTTLLVSICTVAGLRLEKSPAQLDWTGIGIVQRRRLMGLGGTVFPKPTNPPQSRPNDRFIQQPPSAKKTITP